MTKLHSRALKNGIYRKSTPVEAMMARKSMQAEYLELGIACLMTEHGSELREMLASLAYLIGIGAEVARAVPVAGQNRPGLHQALEAVVGMGCNGCRWDGGWGAQLSMAVDISIDLFCSYRALASRFEPGARQLSIDIREGKVRADVLVPLPPQHVPA